MMDTWLGARAPSEAGMLPRSRLSVSRLVDGLGGPALSNAALLIEGNRIVAVGVDASVPRPEDCLELTFPNATALPGLIDAHVHLTVSWEATRDGTVERYVGETDGDLVTRAA